MLLLNTTNIIWKPYPVWTLEEALILLRDLEIKLEPFSIHVGLTGSSGKDLDVILYPRTIPTNTTVKDVIKILVSMGFLSDEVETPSAASIDSGSSQVVKVFNYNSKRIDVFFLAFSVVDLTSVQL